MNNTEGLKQVLEQQDSIYAIARCLDPNRHNVIAEALKVIIIIIITFVGSGFNVSIVCYSFSRPYAASGATIKS